MCKPLFLFLSFLFICIIQVNAQVHKRYIDGNYKFIKDKDSTKSYGYVLYEKFEQDSTVVWSAVRYDKYHNLLFKGFYLDEELTILHGKVVYYQTVIEQKSIGEHAVSIDTVMKVKITGFYDNGIKEGIWTTYYANGVKESSANYENNYRNGLYESFDDHGIIYSRGNYLDQVKEGDWYFYNADSTIHTRKVYKYDRLIDTKEYGNEGLKYAAYPRYNFKYHLSKYLKNKRIPTVMGGAVISFTIDENGNIIKPKLLTGVNAEFDKALIDAISNSPKWEPAYQKKKTIAEEQTLVFEYKSK